LRQLRAHVPALRWITAIAQPPYASSATHLAVKYATTFGEVLTMSARLRALSSRVT